MARLLPTEVIPAFLEAYGVTEFEDVCPAEELTVKIWDKYGPAPKDGDEIKPTGPFVAVIVFCDGCDRSVQLHREQLAAVHA